ncbi:hypothetical protein AVEN_189151-1 [Araneus ventricosus]|uniref:Uncharacterized protein n=1 Tax=Araneus ventricosus TaxID=182803 RepID=A0A4Y2NLN7_ARAVE|nr:hypothetical protein AVEN_189151-1 [Araneus ventricosus]
MALPGFATARRNDDDEKGRKNHMMGIYTFLGGYYPRYATATREIREPIRLFLEKPAGVFSPKLSRIIPQKGAVSPSPAWLKKFEPTVTQNPMTIRRFFIIVIEKYLGKE